MNDLRSGIDRTHLVALFGHRMPMEALKVATNHDLTLPDALLALQEIADTYRRSMDVDERACVDALATAWDAFVALPPEHDDDLGEFRAAIHSAQNIVLSRPTRRGLAIEVRKNG